jgi:acetyltransferase-like isoleucine patch superfamily enzyme
MRGRKGNEPVVGRGCHIADNVQIGDGSVIGDYVVIEEGTVIGENVRIDPFVHLGKRVLKSPNSAVTNSGPLSHLKIGQGSMVGTGAVLYRGSEIGEEVLVADYATLRENVRIGRKSIIGRGAAVENGSTVGGWCKIETNAYITAYSQIGDYCFVGPCVVTSNDNFVGRTKERFKHFKGVMMEEGARIGAGAVLLPGITVGRDALVGAGSVVLKDVDAGTVVAGNPARFIKEIPFEQRLDQQGWQGKQ